MATRKHRFDPEREVNSDFVKNLNDELDHLVRQISEADRSWTHIGTVPVGMQPTRIRHGLGAKPSAVQIIPASEGTCWMPGVPGPDYITLQADQDMTVHVYLRG